MHVHVEHRFERTDVEGFVEVYYSEAFNHQVAGAASLAVRELVASEKLADGRIRRRVRMVPEVRLPGPIRGLLRGAPIQYFEVSTYDPETQTAEYAIESAAGDLIKVWGTITFRAGAGKTVERAIDGEVLVKVPALGRMIERLIGREVRGRYDRIQAFTQRYLDERNA